MKKNNNKKKIKAFISLQFMIILSLLVVFIKISSLIFSLQAKQYYYFHNQEKMKILKKEIIKYLSTYECLPYIDENNNIIYEGVFDEVPEYFRKNEKNNFFKIKAYQYANIKNKPFSHKHDDIYLIAVLYDEFSQIPIYTTEVDFSNKNLEDF